MGAWLSPRAAIAAATVGGAVAVGTGWGGLALLSVFFVSSSLLTPGGGRREPIQVAANGGVAAVAALLALAHSAAALAFAGALAAAAADTWSTEIGGRSRRPPRLITSGRTVPHGTSGGVTLLGSAGGALGASLIAVSAILVGVAPAGAVAWVAAGGVAGGVSDSLLGATLQVRYRCGCGFVGEQARHGCGESGTVVSGVRAITNDTVNLIATLVGAAVASAPVALRALGLA